MRIGNKLIYPELSYQVNGILFEVHNNLGRFCNEQQYGDALENHLKNNNITYIREYTLPPSFDRELKGRNKVDFIIEDKLLLELKAKRVIEKGDYYQTMRYLKALNKKLGIIVNFRDKLIKPKRIINSYS
ncbi:MAG: GxxExxY protein [Patescibacteria group bacterium]